ASRPNCAAPPVPADASPPPSALPQRRLPSIPPPRLRPPARSMRPACEDRDTPAKPPSAHHRSTPTPPSESSLESIQTEPTLHRFESHPSMRIALRRNLVPAELVGSGRDRTVVVMAAFGRERIDDPRQLVGERHRGQLEFVLDGLALEQSARPAAQGVVMPFAGGERRAGAHDQKLAQIAVAHLGDAPEPRLAAARMLTRGQPEEGGELPPAGKRAEVLDRGEERRGGNRADPRNGHQAPRGLVGLGGRLKLLVDMPSITLPWSSRYMFFVAASGARSRASALRSLISPPC